MCDIILFYLVSCTCITYMHVQYMSVHVHVGRDTLQCMMFVIHSRSSLALNRFKEFLTSNLLYVMYCDALSSGSNLDFATSEKPQSFLKLQSFLLTPVHISRVDAFVAVQQALGSAVCR